MTSTEETRFIEAFNEVLTQDPNTPPGPTAINRLLNEKYDRKRKRTPDNTLNGRMSGVRRRLLREAGFVQHESVNEYGGVSYGRWYRP